MVVYRGFCCGVSIPIASPINKGDDYPGAVLRGGVGFDFCERDAGRALAYPTPIIERCPKSPPQVRKGSARTTRPSFPLPHSNGDEVAVVSEPGAGSSVSKEDSGCMELSTGDLLQGVDQRAGHLS